MVLERIFTKHCVNILHCQFTFLLKQFDGGGDFKPSKRMDAHRWGGVEGEGNNWKLWTELASPI